MQSIDLLLQFQRYSLNMFYPLKDMSNENTTNYYISSVMNEFKRKFQTKRNKIFILDYKDDLLSVITYRILKNLQSCGVKFQLVLTGKISNTKKYLAKERRISLRRATKFVKKNWAIIVRPNNPIYKVSNSTIGFKDFGCETYEPIAKFTPQQLGMIQVFYNIGYIQEDPIQIDRELKDKNSKVKKFNDLCYLSIDKDNILDYIATKDLKSVDIGFAELGEDRETNEKILNYIEDFDGVVFYNSKVSKVPSDFTFFVQNKANVPNKLNVTDDKENLAKLADLFGVNFIEIKEEIKND